MPFTNVEDRIANSKKYYQANKDKIDKRNSEWAKKNPDKAYKSHLKWNRKNKDKVNTHAQHWRENNKERDRECKRIRQEKFKQMWRLILKEKNMISCSNCGYDKCFDAIDYHHVNANDKKIAISSLWQEKPTTMRLKELDKCIVLCSNCHRELHALERMVK